MHEPTGYELPFSEVVTKATVLPTIVTGRFRTLADADQVIEDGIADMVGMTRAHIADPDIVVKTTSGRADEVRTCLGCNQGCLGGFSLGRLACTVNADVGFENERGGAYDRVAVARAVLVVGGGPAGLEAARVAALRGHRVVLCEAAGELGGNMRWSRLFPGRAGIGDSVDWLVAAIGRLGVEVRLDTRVDDATIGSMSPDVVVVATGGQPAPGEEALTSIDIARMDAPPAGVSRVLLVDRFGSYEVLGVAEKFVQWGVDVEVVTPFKTLAPKVISEQVITPALERIGTHEGRFVARCGWDADASLPGADAVIVIDRRSAPLGLSESSTDGREVHIVGDAAEPGNLWAAIRTGNAVGRMI